MLDEKWVVEYVIEYYYVTINMFAIILEYILIIIFILFYSTLVILFFKYYVNAHCL